MDGVLGKRVMGGVHDCMVCVCGTHCCVSTKRNEHIVNVFEFLTRSVAHSTPSHPTPSTNTHTHHSSLFHAAAQRGEVGRTKQEQALQIDTLRHDLSAAHRHLKESEDNSLALARRADKAETSGHLYTEELMRLKREVGAQQGEGKKEAKAALKEAERWRREAELVRLEMQTLKISEAKREAVHTDESEVTGMKETIHRLELDIATLEQQLAYNEREMEKMQAAAQLETSRSQADVQRMSTALAESRGAAMQSVEMLRSLEDKMTRATSLIDRYEEVVRSEKGKAKVLGERVADLVSQLKSEKETREGVEANNASLRLSHQEEQQALRGELAAAVGRNVPSPMRQSPTRQQAGAGRAGSWVGRPRGGAAVVDAVSSGAVPFDS